MDLGSALKQKGNSLRHATSETPGHRQDRTNRSQSAGPPYRASRPVEEKP